MDAVSGSSNQAVNQTNAANREPKNELEKDEFLKLLVTQLRYQDPMSPMDNKDFIAQMAQFSALEQTQNMSSNLVQAHALGMIGRWVSAQSAEGEPVEGIVTGVKMEKSGPKLMLEGDIEVEMTDVNQVELVVTIPNGPPTEEGENGQENPE